MRRKIYVTPAEMLVLREQGMSNRDIAASLDVSVQTVQRYIGNQGKRMESFEAFRDKPLIKKEEAKTESVAVIPMYEPKPVLERYNVGLFGVEMDCIAQFVTITGECGEIAIDYKDVPDLVQFLAWAMRTRMEVREDADKLKTEGCEI